MHSGDVRPPGVVVVHLEFRREHVPLALLLPEPPPYGVLGGDAAEQPLPTTARRVPLVLRTLGPAKGVAHDEFARGQVGPAFVEERPAAGAGLGEGVALGEAFDGLGLRIVVEAPVLPAAQHGPDLAVDGELDVGFEDGVGERGDPYEAVDVGAGGGMRPVEPHLPHSHGEYDRPLGARRHDPVAEDLSYVVEQRAGRGRGRDDSPYVRLADRGEFGDPLERRAVEHPALGVELGGGVVGGAFGGGVGGPGSGAGRQLRVGGG